MKKVLLDTNALMAIAELKIDVFVELEKECDFKYEIYILRGTILELKNIMEQQPGKYKRAAKLALDIVQKKEIKIIEKKGKVDDILTELSKQGCLIVTQDKELKKRLTKPYLTIRQGKRIVVVR